MPGIVVGVDGSEGAAHALTWAAREAEIRDWPLTAVLVWGFLDQHPAVADAGFDPNYGDEQARAALDTYVTRALGEARARDAQRSTICDLPAAGLLGASTDASLLVVGARGLGGFRGLLLGSVSEQCLHHAPCPIAVVRLDDSATEGDRVQRVVVGVDGSEASHRALMWAVEEARLRGASLEVIHAWHIPYMDGSPFVAAAVDPRVFEDAARTTLTRAVTGLGTKGLAHPVEPILINDSAASALLDSSKGADLVVVGSRGRGGFTELLLGSVSHHVTHHAACPVVVVPSEG